MEFVTKEPIHKGWSGDLKYRAVTLDGTSYLLRITPKEKSAGRAEMFRIQQRVAALGVPMCRAVEFGECEDGVYTVETWIDGEDAESAIPLLPDARQYDYGLEAGRILRKIHSIPAPEPLEDWESRFNRKMDYKIQKYMDCPIHYENGQVFIDYIRENRHLLKGRPQVFQHGDYHIGNMMIDRDGKLQIIDFGRYDFGDPWEEFNRIVWCAQKSSLFASGMVDGYFEGDVPLEFWRLLALYISSNALSSVYWAIPFGQEEVETMLNQAKDILRWYDNMRNTVPTWYLTFDAGEEGSDTLAVIQHYDALIDEGNDPIYDPQPLQEYMDKWDGAAFIEQLRLNSKKTVLEIGVGTGRLAVRAAPLCGAFYGIDISPKTIKRAKKNLASYENVTLICADFLSYKFECLFDIVYFSLTFMHIKDKLRAINKIAGLLNDGGRFVLSIDKNPAEFMDFGARKLKIYPDKPEEIKNFISAAGLTILD